MARWGGHRTGRSTRAVAVVPALVAALVLALLVGAAGAQPGPTAPEITLPPVTLPPVTVPEPVTDPLPPAVGDTVDGTVGGVTGAVDDVLGGVNGAVDGALGGGSSPAPPSGPGTDPRALRDPSSPTATAAGPDGDANDGPARASSSPGAGAGGATDRGTSDADRGGLGERLAASGGGGLSGDEVRAAPADALGEAVRRDARRFAWPVLLALAIAAFLVLQDRADRHERKLADAPLDQGERLRFR